MSMKRLAVREMVGISHVWTVLLRQRITNIPLIAVWLPALDEVHAGAMRVLAKGARNDDAVALLTAQLAAVDQRFDDTARACSLRLECEYYYCRTSMPDRAAQCEKARQLMFPEGLQIVNVHFLAEAGHAKSVADLVEKEPWVKQLLSTIALDQDKHLLSLVETWCALGEQLASLETERSLLGIKAGEPDAPRPIDILAARNAWHKIVGTVLSCLEVIEGHDGTIEAMRKPVLQATEAAAKRHASGKESDEDEPFEGCPAALLASAANAPAKVTAPAAAEVMAAAATATATAEIPPGFPGAKPYILSADACTIWIDIDNDEGTFAQPGREPPARRLG